MVVEDLVLCCVVAVSVQCLVLSNSRSVALKCEMKCLSHTCPAFACPVKIMIDESNKMALFVLEVYP